MSTKEGANTTADWRMLKKGNDSASEEQGIVMASTATGESLSDAERIVGGLPVVTASKNSHRAHLIHGSVDMFSWF